MSLINDVFRDLENRNQPIGDYENVVAGQLDDGVEASTRGYVLYDKSYRASRVVYVLLSAGLILGAGVLLQPAHAPMQSDIAVATPHQTESRQGTVFESDSAKKTNIEDYPTRLVLAAFRGSNETAVSDLEKNVELPLAVDADDDVERHIDGDVSEPDVTLLETQSDEINRLDSSKFKYSAQSLLFSTPAAALVENDAKGNGDHASKSDASSEANHQSGIVENVGDSPIRRSKNQFMETTAAVLERASEIKGSPSLDHLAEIDDVTEEYEEPEDSFIQVTPRPLTLGQQLLNDHFAAAKIYRDGNIDEAEHLLKELLSIDSTQHESRLLLVRLYSEQGQERQAETVLSNALMKFPQHARYASLYAQLLAERGQDEAALDVLENALPAVNDNADLHGLMAGLYQRIGDTGAAAESYMKAIQLDSTRGEWWTGLGISSEQLGNTQRANMAYTAALQLPLARQLKQYVENRLKELSANQSANQSQIEK